MACLLKGEEHGLYTKGGGGMACILKGRGHSLCTKGEVAWPVY